MSNKEESSAVGGGGTALVPKLRFPDFVGQPIQALQVADATTESTERNGSGQTAAQIMGVSKVEGIVPMVERIVAADTARYKFVRKDWFAYNPMRINIGSIARWKGEDDILVSPDYVVFKCKSSGPHRLDPRYLDHFRRSDAWEDFVSEKGDGSVRVRIYYRDLARLQLALPFFPEQQKIADCLDSADALIEAQAQKVEALKSHKRGLMQQLFPRPERVENGIKMPAETLPRVRFPEFAGAGAWIRKTLNETCEIINNRRRPIASSLRAAGPYPYYGASGIVDYIDDFIFDETLLLIGEDGAKWGAFEQTAFLARGKYWVNNHAHVLRPVTAVDAFLTNYLIMIDISPHVTGAAPPKLTLGKLKEIQVPLPPTRHEQQRIADCLTSLDDRIAAETQKLDTLKTHKKGLMQQLFPKVVKGDV